MDPVERSLRSGLEENCGQSCEKIGRRYSLEEDWTSSSSIDEPKDVMYL
jgi:hypothetical protein